MTRLHRTLRLLLGALAVVALVVVVAGCGDDNNDNNGSSSAASTTPAADSKVIQKNSANAGKKVTVGSKNFTEQFLLGEIYAQALEAAGYTVKKELNLGSEQIADKAVKSGQVDAYPEYPGTALTSFFDVKIDDVPKDAQQAYELTKSNYAKEGLTALDPTPFTNSNGVGVTKEFADKEGLKTISDLAPKSKGLTFTGPPECRQRPDCLIGLQKVYDVKFTFKPVDISTRYELLDKGQTDVTEVFTTDGPLSTGKYVLLEDDKHVFPPYNATLVVRDAAIKSAGPDLAKVVNLVTKGLTTPVMQELNSRVDLDKQKPAAVAQQYLKESGYIQ
jgi:glycine betaine/choline ABC-type transport system substrate-binding protein